MSMAERLSRLHLRALGTVSLSALIFVAVPYAQMDAIHRWLGLGRLPDAPIVGYLARSTSAFYAFLGGLLWVVSFDLRRHRQVLCYVGCALIALGAALFAVDWLEGLPLFWRVGEGPIDAAFGASLLWLGLREHDDR